jgi:hypothetical protein
MQDENDTVDMMAKFQEHQERPGFIGTHDFPIVIEIGSVRTQRRARIAYQHTPEWEYFDLNKKALRIGGGSWTYAIHVLAEPSAGAPDGELGSAGHVSEGLEYPIDDSSDDENDDQFRWVQMTDLTKFGVLSEDVIDELFAAIDEKCRAENLERRKAHGL